MAALVSAKDATDFNEEWIKEFKKIRPTALLQLIKGERPFQDSDKRNVELAAKVLVWRMSWPLKNTDNKFMDDARKEFDQEINALLDKENRNKNKDYRKVFAKYLVGCFKDVFNLPFEANRVGHLNAAILLPKLARLQEEEIGDFLTALIRDPKQNDAVKLYALKGLAAFFPAYEWTLGGAIAPKDNNGNAIPAAQKQKYIDRLQAVIDYIDRTWESSRADDDAIRFLRREAIRTLGQAQVPAVEVNNQKVSAPVAKSLLRVLDPKGGMEPSPSLQEKVEAAIGICQIKVIPNTLYIPDEGIYRVGTFLVDFANAYKKDRGEFFGGGKTRKLPSIPWKIQSERLLQALKLQVKNNDIKNAQRLLDSAQPYLNAMKSHAEIDSPKELGAVVNSMRPKSAEIYKGVKAAEKDE
jgi:hypothetical protein